MDFELWKFLAGLGAFLLSITLVEDALKILGSRGFKIILRKHTNNHFKSIIVGALSTAILQSSSAVTLMLLALVGSGIIQFTNALGIVLGANLGTTFTGWIVSYLGFKVNINTAIYPIMAVGSLIYAFFPSKPRLHQWGKFAFGLGFLFFGLNMMKDSMAGLHSSFDPAELAEYHYLVFALAGAIFTAVIQSSSATMTITLTALHAGLIPLEGACALMVGADLGTTLTVILGSTAGGHRKKQVAAAHFFFNLVTDLVTLIVLIPLLNLATWIIGPGEPLYTLVTFYSGFNLMGIFLFVPFLKKFAEVLQQKFPSSSSSYLKIDINTSVPEAATTTLLEHGENLLRKTYLLNSTVAGHKIDRPQFRNLTEAFGTHDYLECYKYTKVIEATLLKFSFKTQEQPLTESQSYQLRQVQSGSRNCSYSVKGLKDIWHNLAEFKNSSSDSVVFLSKKLKEVYRSWLCDIEDLVFSKPEEENLFENLIMAEKELEKSHLEFLDEINSYVSDKRIDLKHVPSLFNANREFFSSCRALSEAIADLHLSREQNKDFSLIPKNID